MDTSHPSVESMKLLYGPLHHKLSTIAVIEYATHLCHITAGKTFFKGLPYVYKYFACMHDCASCVWPVLKETRKGCWIP